MLRKICLGQAGVVATLLVVIRFAAAHTRSTLGRAGKKVAHEQRTNAQAIGLPVGYFHATRLRTHLSRPGTYPDRVGTNGSSAHFVWVRDREGFRIPP